MAEGPLTEQDFEDIKEKLALLDDVDQQIKLAQQAGVDVEGQREQSRQSREQLTRLKQTYFPGRT